MCSEILIFISFLLRFPWRPQTIACQLENPLSSAALCALRIVSTRSEISHTALSPNFDMPVTLLPAFDARNKPMYQHRSTRISQRDMLRDVSHSHVPVKPFKHTLPLDCRRFLDGPLTVLDLCQAHVLGYLQRTLCYKPLASSTEFVALPVLRSAPPAGLACSRTQARWRPSILLPVGRA